MVTLHKFCRLQAMLQAKLSSLPPKLQHQAWHAHDMGMTSQEIGLIVVLTFTTRNSSLLRRLLQVSCLQTVLRYENKQLQRQAWRFVRWVLETAWNFTFAQWPWTCATNGLLEGFHKPGISVSEGPFQKQSVENMTWPCFKSKSQGGQPQSKGDVLRRSSAFETWNHSEQLHDVVCICQVYQTRRWMKSLFALSMPVPAPRAPTLARQQGSESEIAQKWLYSWLRNGKPNE